MLKTKKTIEILRQVLPWQYVHIIGSCLWNIAGIILVAVGQQALGPTASLFVTILLLALGVGLWIGYKRFHVLYIVISLLLALVSIMAIREAFIGAPSGWPSTFWRWAGALLNFIGLISNLSGVFIITFKNLNLSKSESK